MRPGDQINAEEGVQKNTQKEFWVTKEFLYHNFNWHKQQSSQTSPYLLELPEVQLSTNIEECSIRILVKF